MSLAQVFWLKDPAGQPLRLYAVAEKELGIAADFADFGTDIAKLRKRLRARGAVVEDSFPPQQVALRAALCQARCSWTRWPCPTPAS